MSKSKDTEAAASGFQIFSKAGTEGKRMAINLQSGLVIEESRKGEAFIYIGGRQHHIATDLTLEELAGVTPVAVASETE